MPLQNNCATAPAPSARVQFAESLKKTVEIDKDRYTHVGIDDFAIRRGHTYGTCMIDHETHAVIDMIPTRDQEEVSAWLMTWKNLKLVTRDGSYIYRAAIQSAHPSCIQVADRFHLLKNVLDGAERTIRNMLPGKVRLSNNEAAADGTGTQTGTEPLTASEHQRQARAMESRRLHLAGVSYSQIAKHLGLDRKTVKKYCEADFSPRFHSTRKRRSKLDGFRDTAVQMANAGNRATEIFDAVKKIGYKGSYQLVQRYVKSLKDSDPVFREVKTAEHAVECQHLISLVYKPITKIPELTTEELAEVLECFPALWEVYQFVDAFHYALFHGTPEQLAEWVAQAADCRFPKLASAAEGIRRDLEAAANAVTHPYSNGVVEGSNTKIKLTKRIMYGRCHFSTMRTKILLKEQRRLRAA